MNAGIALGYLSVELRAQWGRFALAVLSVALGVGLALAIHLVNHSALAEFGRALALINGQAQAQLLPTRSDAFDETIYVRLLGEPQLAELLAHASPVIDIPVQLPALADNAIRLIGLDPFRAGAVTPALLPSPSASIDTAGAASVLFADDTLFVSSALERALAAERVQVRHRASEFTFRVAGQLPGVGADSLLAVTDIANLQWRLGWQGKLSRIDLVWRDGVNVEQAQISLAQKLGPSVKLVAPELAGQQTSNLSRAYRVNLTVLSLVATFTGGFLVWNSLAAALTRQSRSLALVGILGVSRGGLNNLVLAAGLCLGVAGALLGSVLGFALAQALLTLIGTDLGAGYFSSQRNNLILDRPALVATLLFAGLGILSALAGAWAAARTIRSLPFAQALRGYIEPQAAERSQKTNARRRNSFVSRYWPLSWPISWPLTVFALGALLLAAPPIAGLPLAAYLAIALWLAAGIYCTRYGLAAVSHVLTKLEVHLVRRPVLWLAVQRSLSDRAAVAQSARAAAAVVASFALACAMATMVYSFRGSVADWLTRVLPADIYGRAGQQAGDGLINLRAQQRLRSLPGIERFEFARSLTLSLDTNQAEVSLIARPGLKARDASQMLPMTGEARRPPLGLVPVFVSEAVVSLHRLRPGDSVKIPALHPQQDFFVAGVWRDYARQTGTLAIDLDDYQRLTGDSSINELALWLRVGSSSEAILARVQSDEFSDLPPMQWRATAELRELSLKIFDRSFTLTYVLEAIAIVVAIAGVTASYGAQALSRLREFAVSRYLGFAKRDLLTQLSLEAALVLGIAVIWGLLLGLAIAMILVFRVNPQSFHWTMELRLPLTELLVAASVLIALGTAASVLTANRMMRDRLQQTLKDDW